MSDETPIADAKTESKPKPARKSKQKKAKNKPKRNSHAHRPRATISYWIEGIEKGKFKGADLVQAIERVEAYEKERARKKLEKSGTHSNALRSILSRDPKANAPTVESQPVARIAENSQDPKPQSQVIAPPEITNDPEPAPITFEDVLEQIRRPSGKTYAEEVGEMAARIRDVPAEMDDNARRLIARAWSKIH